MEGNSPLEMVRKKNSHQILHNENTDGSPSVHGVHLALFFKEFDGKNRAGKTQGKTDQCCLGQTKAGKLSQTIGGAGQDEHSQKKDGAQGMDGGPAPDLRLCQPFELKLKADGEQKQDNPQIGNRLQGKRTFGQAKKVHQKAGDKKSEHGRQIETLEGKAQEKGAADPDTIDEGCCMQKFHKLL